MTAVTVNERFETAPAHEYVVLSITEAYTYVSKLSKVFGVNMTRAEDNDSYLNYSVSGRTITFHASGTANKKVFCDIVGYL
jgi:hypothetical protein